MSKHGTDSPHTLSGTLGVGSIVFMVVAAAAPLTVIAGTVPLGVAAGNGPAFPTTFALCCAILLLFAVGFCAMSRHVPNAGAFYAYVQRGLGRAPGLGSAFLALATYTAVQLAVYGYIGAVLDGLVQHYGGPALPWWLWSVIALTVVGFLGYRNIELSSKVLGALLIAEVAIVLVFDAVVIAPRRRHLSTACFSRARWSPARSVSRSCSPSRRSSASRRPPCSATRPATRSAPSPGPPTWRCC